MGTTELPVVKEARVVVFFVCKREIAHKLGKFARVLEVDLNGKHLSTPTYFPSISSQGVRFRFQELLELMKIRKYPRVLVSAYDLYTSGKTERRRLLSMIKNGWEKGFIFLDSGLYESWSKAKPKWDISSYTSFIPQVKFDLYSSFDFLPNQLPRITNERFRKKTFSNILESSFSLDRGLFVPILHESNRKKLVHLVREFVEEYPDLCTSIAVAERDCGKSILERAETMIAIRKMLDERDPRSLLHLLGCGNPLSMLVFSYCGVDMYDSLDWVKSVVNPENLSLWDLSHLGLINCSCRVCTNPAYERMDYFEKALLHNLLFYQNFVVEIQKSIRNENMPIHLRTRIGETTMNQLEKSGSDDQLFQT